MEEYEDLKSQNNDFAKESDCEILENDLTALAIYGLADPLRPDIEESIKSCKKAGIEVVMCTGDNIDTAIAISKNAGIVTAEQVAKSKYTCMTGKDFREAVGGLKKVKVDGFKEEQDRVSNMKAFKEIQENLKVLARSSPDDKYILVTGIQQNGGVVAVTGDGTNDAPALTQADVGFAMGITGTDVAKGASDIILLDDNFSSIIVALKYGRSVFDNVRKFLQFQMTVNVVACFIVFFGSAILKQSPMNAVQMLWINLIMDTFAALALATEAPAAGILDRQPYKSTMQITTEVMWRNIFGHAIYQIIILMVVIFAAVPAGLVPNYQNSCLLFAKNEDGTKTCSEYNPFFAGALYIEQIDLDNWDLLNLSKADFNQAALGTFNCLNQVSQELLPFETDCNLPAEQQKALEEPSKVILPQDQKVGAQTQMLFHFTLLF